MQITELILQTTDPAKLTDFYGKTLGLAVSEDEGRICYSAGATRLIFEKGQQLQPSTYHFAFGIPAGKLESVRADYADRLQFLSIPETDGVVADFTNWKAQAIYFMDPAGNILEFIAHEGLHAGDDKNHPWIIGVAEIGLVFPVDAYEAGVQELLKRFPVSYYERQRPLAGFCAIGDDRGRFICVPDGRSWYPTDDVPSQQAPVTLHAVAQGISFSYNHYR